MRKDAASTSDARSSSDCQTPDETLLILGPITRSVSSGIELDAQRKFQHQMLNMKTKGQEIHIVDRHALEGRPQATEARGLLTVTPYKTLAQCSEELLTESTWQGCSTDVLTSSPLHQCKTR